MLMASDIRATRESVSASNCQSSLTPCRDNAIYDFSKKVDENLNGLDIFRVFDSLNYFGACRFVGSDVLIFFPFRKCLSCIMKTWVDTEKEMCLIYGAEHFLRMLGMCFAVVYYYFFGVTAVLFFVFSEFTADDSTFIT